MPEQLLSVAIRERRATPHFSSDPVSDDDLKTILEAGLSAPSGYNLQPWRFVVVRDPEQRKALRAAAMNQPKVEEAPVVIVACGDPQAWRTGDLDLVLELSKQYGFGDESKLASTRKTVTNLFSTAPSNAGGLAPDFGLWVNRHTMIAFTTMMWAAETLGYDTAPMEGFYEDKVKATLGIPDPVRVVALLAVGRLTGPDKSFAGRFSITHTVFADSWGKPIQ
jgi:nitroreductase